jgi:hypothetical protein
MTTKRRLIAFSPSPGNCALAFDAVGTYSKLAIIVRVASFFPVRNCKMLTSTGRRGSQSPRSTTNAFSGPPAQWPSFYGANLAGADFSLVDLFLVTAEDHPLNSLPAELGSPLFHTAMLTSRATPSRPWSVFIANRSAIVGFACAPHLRSHRARRVVSSAHLSVALRRRAHQVPSWARACQRNSAKESRRQNRILSDPIDALSEAVAGPQFKVVIPHFEVAPP